MAPNYVKKTPINKSDLWSVGVISLNIVWHHPKNMIDLMTGIKRNPLVVTKHIIRCIKTYS